MELADLFRAFRSAGVELTPEELLDALQLYRLGVQVDLAPAAKPDSDGAGVPAPHRTPEDVQTDQADPANDLQRAPHSPTTVRIAPGSGIYARSPSRRQAEDEDETATAFEAPTIPALREKLALGRALRPLKLMVPSAGRATVDIEQTARRCAMLRLPSAAWRPTRERWLDAVLIIDRSGSYPVWEDTVREARALLESHGSFRRLDTWFLKASGDGGVALTDASGGRVPAGAPVPTARRLIMVLTDGVANYWQGEQTRALIRSWAVRSPVVIAQLMPQRLWGRTGIQSTPAYFHPTGPGYNGELRFTEYGGERDAKTHIAVPLIEWSARRTLPWALMTAGRGQDGMPGSAWVIDREPPSIGSDTSFTDMPLDDDADKPSARAAVLGFQGPASPVAFQLARYLALSGEYLTLPIMRAVQAALLPDSEPADLAEVFLSGLLTVAPGQDGHGRPREFVFPKEIREELRGGVHRVEAAEILHVTGRFLTARERQSSGYRFPAFKRPIATAGAWQPALSPLAVLHSAALELAGAPSGSQAAASPESGISVRQPPAFALVGHPADAEWSSWTAATLEQLGCTVHKLPWPTDGRAPQAAQWASSQHCRLVLLTRRSADDAGWLTAHEVKPGHAPPHLLWVPGNALPPALRSAPMTALFPGDPAASERALTRLVQDTARAAAPDDTVPLPYPLSHRPAEGADAPENRLPVRFPGVTSFTHNLKPRKQYFVGRDRELAAIHAALNHPARAPLAAFAIAGPPGSGKTELATEYAYEYGADYDLVWMVRADDPVTLGQDLVEFDKRLESLGRPGRGYRSSPLSERRFVPPRCLVIFHLVAHPRELERVWPVAGAGHVLVTTWSAAAWRALVAGEVELGPLPVADARTVLQLNASANDRPFDSGVLRRLDKLSERARTPLGLNQLADAPRRRFDTKPSHELDLGAAPHPASARQSAPRADFSVGLVGGPGSGKTTFAAALSTAVEQHQRSGTAWTLTAADPSTLDFQTHTQHLLLSRGQFPPASTEWRYYSWRLRREASGTTSRWRRRRPEARDIVLGVSDVPGGLYSSLPDIWDSDALNPVYGADGLILLVDPTSDPDTGANTAALLHGVLSRLTAEALDRGEMPDGRLPHRLSVCVTKFDRQELFDFARQGRYLSVDTRTSELRLLPDDASRMFSGICRYRGDSYRELDRLIRQLFEPGNVRYFATSAIGLYSSNRLDFVDSENVIIDNGTPRIRGKVKPLNVLEPLLWAGAAAET